MLDVICVIFAGGKSSRMGEDKSLLPFPPYDTLSEFQFQRLQKIFKKVYISTKEKEKFHFKANFLEDIVTDDIFAPTIGFISIFEKLQCEKVFVLSVDTPFVTEEIIKQIVQRDSDSVDATIARIAQGIQPLCGIYHISLLPFFRKMLEEDNHKLGYLLKKRKTNFIDFEDKISFLNLNNPSEYKEALTHISL